MPPKDWRHRIDINAASEEELTLLPGVGPAYAGRLVRNRREAGPFRTLGDLRRVPGLPQHLGDRIRNHATAQHPGGP
jgi:competence ComEA-like helix-hairpin-helix protein